MITTRELSATNIEKKNMWLLPVAVLVAAVFLIIGGGMFYSGIKNGVLLSWILGLLVMIVGLLVGFLLLAKALEPFDKVYELFREHDVVVEAPASRLIECLALEKFNGELKPALHYVAESAELYRYERAEYIAGLHDYEKRYIREYYQKDPMRVAQASKTKVLTAEVIQKKGFSLFGEDSEFVLVRAMCSQKTQPSYLADGDEKYRLYFGDYACSYICSAALYNTTVVGEEFYLVKGADSGKIYLAYSVLDWHLDQALLDLLYS